MFELRCSEFELFCSVSAGKPPQIPLRPHGAAGYACVSALRSLPCGRTFPLFQVLREVGAGVVFSLPLISVTVGLKRRPLAPHPHPRYGERCMGPTKNGGSLIILGLKMGGRSATRSTRPNAHYWVLHYEETVSCGVAVCLTNYSVNAAHAESSSA